MGKHYIAKKYAMSSGIGVSQGYGLPSFDKALLDAGVGNYNLVRLSSILPAHCKQVEIDRINEYIKQGSLLPTAYATITSDVVGERIASAVGIGFSDNAEDVNVIMEYSNKGITADEAARVVYKMLKEAFAERGWNLVGFKHIETEATVEKQGDKVTTFACVAEW